MAGRKHGEAAVDIIDNNRAQVGLRNDVSDLTILKAIPTGFHRAFSYCSVAQVRHDARVVIGGPWNVARGDGLNVVDEVVMPTHAALAAPISSEGVVLSQPIKSTTPSTGLPRMLSSTSMLARLR